MADKNTGQDWMKKDLGELIDQLDLTELQKRSLRSRWLDQVAWMDAKASKVQFQYYALRITAIVGGVIVPSLVGLSFDGSANSADGRGAILRGVVFVLGLVVAISIAVEEFFHYGERWRHYRSTVEMLKSEGWQLFQLSGSYKAYKSHADAYRLFAERVEQILSADVKKFITEIVTEKKDVKQPAGEATDRRETPSESRPEDAAAIPAAVAATGTGTDVPGNGADATEAGTEDDADGNETGKAATALA